MPPLPTQIKNLVWIWIILLSHHIQTPITFAQPGPLRATFTKVADTSTGIPAGTGTFATFGDVVISDRNVAFDGADAAGNKGIYRYVDGVLESVADETTIIPGRLDAFTNLQAPAMEGVDVAFLGSRGFGPGDYVGIFSTVGGLHKAADITDRPPNQPGNRNDPFFSFGGPTLNNGFASFPGSTTLARHQGVFRETATSAFNILVDNNTFIPNTTEKFTVFYGFIDGEGNGVAFRGGDADTLGMYLWDGDLTFIADPNTPAPDGGALQNFGSPSVSEANVAFFASETVNLSNPGIYAFFDGQLHTIADTSTTIPGSGAAFALFGESPSISRGNVLFGGEGSGNFREGIYLWLNNLLFPVIKRNELLGGKVIFSLGTGQKSFSGRHAAMRVNFTDTTWAVYRATMYAVCDLDFNGHVDWTDLAGTVHCLAGPEAVPDSLAEFSCVQTFDVNFDGDVDLADFAGFSRQFSP